jgi:hypothetical protein
MKIIFLMSILILYVFSSKSFAESYIAKIVCNYKKELHCQRKVDKLSFNESIKKDNKIDLINIINESINKENKLPINEVMNFVTDYKKSGALINIGKYNSELFKNKDENKSQISTNLSPRRRGDGRGWTIKLLSVSF